MTETKRRIQKLSKVLRIMCIIASVLVILGACFSAGVMAFVSIRQDFAKKIYDNLELPFSIQLDLPIENLSYLYKILINCFISILTSIIAFVYLRFFIDILCIIEEDGSPFNMKLVKKLKKIAFCTLLIAFFYPFTGAVLFILLMLFSNIFEYGTYLQEKADETNRIQEEMIVSFAEISENKSGQTGQHVKRVSEYSKVIAEEMGLDESQVERVKLASTMHDIGKLLIPSEILDKPGKLTDDEYTQIKKHTTYGGQMLQNVEGEIMGLARTVALEHHERVDGKGYPVGKSGEDISLEGRIVSVADVYDALTSRRSYKKPWSSKKAYDEIVRCSGTQFDESVVEAFKRAYDKIDAIRKQYEDEVNEEAV